MKGNYAVYVRVSTDKDEQISSVENQIDICRNWLERNGYEWQEQRIFKDQGISGTVFLDRPAMQTILAKAKNKEIDMVIFKSISRLARDLKDSLEIREVFIAHHVRIISIEEGYDSDKAGKNDMAFELWSLFSAQYSRTLSSSISAALAAKVRRGEHIGKVPYGYDKVAGFLKVNEEEAHVVRRMYEWYNQGLGYKSITNRLNDLHITPRRKGKWQITSVQRILQNPIYGGDFVLHRYSKIKIGGRKKQIRNSPEKYLLFENHHEPIVAKVLWQQANPQTGLQPRNKITPWNELRGLVKCSQCGSNMVIVQSVRALASGQKKRWSYLKCSLYRRAGVAGCVNHVPMSYEDFRQFVIEQLLAKGKDVSLHFQQQFEDRQQARLKMLEKQLGQLAKKKKGLVDLYLDQLLERGEFAEKRQEIEGELRQTEDEMLRLQSREVTLQQVQTMQQAFERIQEQGQDLYPAFQTLLDEVVVHPDGTVDVKYGFVES
jgi:site-specific DNA recombinase